MSDEKIESEFGKGLTYCLGLFLCHSERYSRDNQVKEILGHGFGESWFNAASDHLYELSIPDFLPEDLRRRLGELKDKSLSWGHGFQMDGKPRATEADVNWAIEEAKELLRMIDEHFGVATVEASWK